MSLQPKITAEQSLQALLDHYHLAPSIYEGNKLRGFYDEAPPQEQRLTNKNWLLSRHNLILSEVMEMYEAFRNNNIHCKAYFTMSEYYYRHTELGEQASKFADAYKLHCKGTCEEELADIVIRLFDFVGSLGYMGNDLMPSSKNREYIYAEKFENVDWVVYDLCTLSIEGTKRNSKTMVIAGLFYYMYYIAQLCEFWQIDIIQAIKWKLVYNSNRPYKHGKSF